MLLKNIIIYQLHKKRNIINKEEAYGDAADTHSQVEPSTLVWQDSP